MPNYMTYQQANALAEKIDEKKQDTLVFSQEGGE